MSNLRPEEAAHIPSTHVHPPTSKRSRYTSTLTQSIYETRNLTVVTQAKRRTGKAQKTPSFNRTPTTEKTIDYYAPDKETIDYEMNGIPHSYGEFPEFRDDPDDDNPLL